MRRFTGRTQPRARQLRLAELVLEEAAAVFALFDIDQEGMDASVELLLYYRRQGHSTIMPLPESVMSWAPVNRGK